MIPSHHYSVLSHLIPIPIISLLFLRGEEGIFANFNFEDEFLLPLFIIRLWIDI